jgi:Glycine rich protein
MRTTLSRYALSLCAATASLAGCGGSQSPMTALGARSDRSDALPYHKTFHYTGSEQSFKVPEGVTSITVVALGAAGDGGSGSTSGHQFENYGRGGRVDAVVPVSSGETLYVFVGGRGEGSYEGGNGFNGGGQGGEYPNCKHSLCYGFGGGGASDVRQGGDKLRNRILVAGGGGGAGTERVGTYGGGGGALIGGNGQGEASSRTAGSGGSGGSQRKGGFGGTPGTDGSYGSGGSGGKGHAGSGGNGGQAGYNPYGYPLYGGAGGGAGGGYYGGGGGGGGAPAGHDGGEGSGAGGGGGSSYVEGSAPKFRMWRGWKNATGNGLVVFSWRCGSFGCQ